jgi:hypothetical protein
VCTARRRRAYADLEEIPSDFFVDDCLVLLSCVPMHRRWEEILIAFANTLPFGVPLTSASALLCSGRRLPSPVCCVCCRLALSLVGQTGLTV